MKIISKNKTIVISSIIFIILGIIFVKINQTISYIMFIIAISIEILDIVIEITEEKYAKIHEHEHKYKH